MLAGIPESQTVYSFEVSGWDNNEDFFVEKEIDCARRKFSE